MHHKTSWTELIWLSSRITRTREHPQNWDCSKIAGIKKKLGAFRQIYEQFGQKIHSVTHHHRPWTSVPVNYVHHASQGVNNRSKRYSTQLAWFRQDGIDFSGKNWTGWLSGLQTIAEIYGTKEGTTSNEQHGCLTLRGVEVADLLPTPIIHCLARHGSGDLVRKNVDFHKNMQSAVN